MNELVSESAFNTAKREQKLKIKEAGGAVPYLIGVIETNALDIKAFYKKMRQDFLLETLWRSLEEYERNAIYVYFLTSKQ